MAHVPVDIAQVVTIVPPIHHRLGLLFQKLAPAHRVTVVAEIIAWPTAGSIKKPSKKMEFVQVDIIVVEATALRDSME